MRYWDRPPHPDLDTTRDFLDRWLAADKPVVYLVWEKDGRAIGAGGIHTANEIGYILRSDQWGKGLATEALSALIPWLFRMRDADALTAEIDPRNAASIAVLTRLGFAETGRAARTIFVAGEWCDSIYFRLPRPPET